MTGGAAGRRGRLNTAYESETESDSEPDTLPPHLEPVLDVEVWADYWSDELATSYHVLLDHTQQQGNAFLERCTFSDFVDFVFKHSSKLRPRS